MNRKKRDNLSYYEVYNERGDLVSEGDVITLAERLNLSVEHVRYATRRGKGKGLEYGKTGRGNFPEISSAC